MHLYKQTVRKKYKNHQEFRRNMSHSTCQQKQQILISSILNIQILWLLKSYKEQTGPKSLMKFLLVHVVKSQRYIVLILLEF